MSQSSFDVTTDLSPVAPITSGSAVKPLYSPQDLADLYQFPKDAQGRGQTIGIIALGGNGGGFDEDDLEQYFRAIGLPKPALSVCRDETSGCQPSQPCLDKDRMQKLIEQLEQEGYKNGKPQDLEAWKTFEATMDIELVGALANQARIIVYFIDPGVIVGLLDYILDLNSQDRPTILSASWGDVESTWIECGWKDRLKSMEERFQALAIEGVTLCFSSGNDGSGRDRELQVSYPASSPYVLACGGTRLKAQGEETVWNEKELKRASGGGESSLLPQPYWQASAVEDKIGTEGRGVPDVAAVADFNTGVKLLVAGLTCPSVGTSAAAPIWASLVARINEKLGVNLGGRLPRLLYQAEISKAMRDITEGNNNLDPDNDTGPYQASPGWDPCTGWGGPDGEKLLAALQALQQASSG